MMEIVKIEINDMTDPPFLALYAKEKGARSYQYRYVGQVWKTGEGFGIAFDGEQEDWLYFTPKQFIEFYNKSTALESRGSPDRQDSREEPE